MNIVLSKQSSESDTRRYFVAIRGLSKSGEEFPVDLDEVWPLVYSAKEKAVRALKSNFIENVDYQVLAQNGYGGKFTSIDYHLSVSCMEYFIARKVRPVFEVYRQVYHKAAGQPERPKTTLDLIELTIHEMREQERQLLEVKQDVAVLKAQSKTRSDYFTVAGYASLMGMECGIRLAASLGQKAAKMCKERGIIMESIPDPRFGKVKTYPESILEEVFSLSVV
jgi:hypothetical protein